MTPSTRRRLLLVCPLVLAAGVVVFGSARDSGSLSLVECVAVPALCDDAELYIGYARVVRVDGRAVFTRSWMGDVQLAPWPVGAPLPSPGQHVSVIGAFGGGRSVLPHEVTEHPLRRRKELVGIAMLAVWALLGLGWTTWAWRRRA